jgi:predicted transcriptional regulator
MAQGVKLIVELTHEQAYELEVLSRRLRRSKAELAKAAIASHLAWHARQMAHIERVLAEDQLGEPGGSHDQVVNWIESWSGRRELKAPGSLVRDAIARIIEHPQIGSPGRVEGTKEFAVPGTDYVVVYKVVGGHARILSVLDSPRSGRG